MSKVYGGAKVTCAESIYQNDNVIENAYEFMDDISQIVGTYDYPDDDDITA